MQEFQQEDDSTRVARLIEKNRLIRLALAQSELRALLGDMRLPNAEHVIVDREKITEYLLNPAHRSGASKARFFGQFGFELAAWKTLAQALREHAQRNEVRKVTETLFGPRYEIIGELFAPDGRAPIVCTVWQMDHGKVAPRLITAYPFRGQETKP